MSLGTRLTLKTAVLVMAVVVVAVAALWGLGGLNRDLDAALGEYDRLREAYTLMSTVEQARSLVRSDQANPVRLRQPVLRALLRLDQKPAVLDAALVSTLRDDLKRSLHAIDGLVPGADEGRYAVTGPLNSALNRLAAEADRNAQRIETIEGRADEHRGRVVWWVALTAGLAALLAIIVGIWQYIAVMRPLRRLQRGVQRLASGDFADRLGAAGDREFVQLAADFNHMADDLAALYQQLEDKVRLRSAQLAQSERLASVGFLAAGVAHEINNPLAIIAGEAELALGEMPVNTDEASRTALTTIRDEAFRCKAITQKLLSLARPGSGTRLPVALKTLAEQVATLVRSLPQHEGRRISVEGVDAIMAETDASQVKQVLLNLVINALEAVEPGSGVVRMVVGQQADRATLAVHDNGKGIDAQTLGRVFEPFYTEKKTPTTPGLGLGLSISHAIVEDLGGRLTAGSEGLGQGSVFTIELPGLDGGTTS